MEQLPVGAGIVATDDPGKTQTPPFKMHIADISGRVIAMVALNAAVGTHAATTEYWFSADGLRLDGDLRIDAVPLDVTTDADIDAWSSPLTSVFSCPRVVQLTDWSKGLAAISTDLTQRLYTMPHPDDATQILGVLLATDARGRLAAAAWYRSSTPDENAQAFESKLFSARLSLVTNRDGSPASDPGLVQNIVWYNIVMPPPR